MNLSSQKRDAANEFVSKKMKNTLCLQTLKIRSKKDFNIFIKKVAIGPTLICLFWVFSYLPMVSFILIFDTAFIHI